MAMQDEVRALKLVPSGTAVYQGPDHMPGAPNKPENMRPLAKREQDRFGSPLTKWIFGLVSLALIASAVAYFYAGALLVRHPFG